MANRAWVPLRAPAVLWALVCSRVDLLRWPARPTSRCLDLSQPPLVHCPQARARTGA